MMFRTHVGEKRDEWRERSDGSSGLRTTFRRADADYS
jgi:hypothetical protein